MSGGFCSSCWSDALGTGSLSRHGPLPCSAHPHPAAARGDSLWMSLLPEATKNAQESWECAFYPMGAVGSWIRSCDIPVSMTWGMRRDVPHLSRTPRPSSRAQAEAEALKAAEGALCSKRQKTVFGGREMNSG